MNTVHRTHALDINLEEFFQEGFSGWYKIEREIIDLSKRNYRKN